MGELAADSGQVAVAGAAAGKDGCSSRTLRIGDRGEKYACRKRDFGKPLLFETCCCSSGGSSLEGKNFPLIQPDSSDNTGKLLLSFTGLTSFGERSGKTRQYFLWGRSNYHLAIEYMSPSQKYLATLCKGGPPSIQLNRRRAPFTAMSRKNSRHKAILLL